MVSQHPAKVSNRKVVRVRVAAVPPFCLKEDLRMRDITNYIRQCFCKHNLKLIKEIRLYDYEWSKMPCGTKLVYRCDKCGYIKKIRI